MASTVNFFNPSNPFGNLTGWEIQNNNPTTGHQRAQALGADGDEIASQTYDAKTTANAVYLATSDTAAIPKAGTVVNGWHIDTVTVAFTNTGFAQMTLAGHKHGTATHASCRTYTGSLTTVGTKFGCPATIPGLSIPQGAGVRSMTWTQTVNHVDELGSNGNWLAADNYDGSETVEVELCDSGAITATTGWDLTSTGNTQGNTQAETTTATAEHHIAHDTST